MDGTLCVLRQRKRKEGKHDSKSRNLWASVWSYTAGPGKDAEPLGIIHINGLFRHLLQGCQMRSGWLFHVVSPPHRERIRLASRIIYIFKVFIYYYDSPRFPLHLMMVTQGVQQQVLTQRSSERLSVSTGFRWWSLHTGVPGWARWCAVSPAMATHREQTHFLRQSWTWFWLCTLQQKKHGK